MNDSSQIKFEAEEIPIWNEYLFEAWNAIQEAIDLSQDRIVDSKVLALMLKTQAYIDQMILYVPSDEGAPF